MCFKFFRGFPVLVRWSNRPPFVPECSAWCTKREKQAMPGDEDLKSWGGDFMEYQHVSTGSTLPETNKQQQKETHLPTPVFAGANCEFQGTRILGAGCAVVYRNFLEGVRLVISKDNPCKLAYEFPRWGVLISNSLHVTTMSQQVLYPQKSLPLPLNNAKITSSLSGMITLVRAKTSRMQIFLQLWRSQLQKKLGRAVRNICFWNTCWTND